MDGIAERRTYFFHFVVLSISIEKEDQVKTDYYYVLLFEV